MGTDEIKSSDLNVDEFIAMQVEAIKFAVGDKIAINALSGGVDSSVVAMLGHRALGKNMKNYFINNGLMRKGEAEEIVSTFARLGVYVDVIKVSEEFFTALKGITYPEEKREAITQTFYKYVFFRLLQEIGASCLFQGTILTDIDETVAGIKRQHNVFAQIGIDPEKAFGYKIIEPLVQLRKDGVRLVAKALGFPESVYKRPPFPGPALAARIIGEVTREKVKIVRQATEIMENLFSSVDSFQNMAILHNDRVTGMVNGERSFGLQIEIRCWDSIDARTAEPMSVDWPILFKLGRLIPERIPEVVSVTYQISPKPPSTMEAI